MRVLFFAFLLTTTVLAAPIYQPAFHGPLPGREHEFQIQHVKHVDKNGHVTYIHDKSDHRPDFCAIPGEEELCRLQIEAANNAPAVNDADTIVIEGAHDDDELAPGHDAILHDSKSLASSQASDQHAADNTVTLDNGDVITIHPENGHIRNINDGGVDASNGHIPNIKPQQGQSTVRQETIQSEDEIVIPSFPHQRNINDGHVTVTPPENAHIPNINHGQSVSENIASTTDAPVNSPFPGAFGPHTIASHPIIKLQEAIRKQNTQI